MFAFYLRYEATAISHGHLPALVTTAMNAPRGVSLMWNTSILLPGIVLSPVTLLAGPQVSLTVLLTLSFAGSAASLYWVLRRWGASLGAAALGGAVYGFSPALLDTGIAHWHLVFAVLPPLIIDALLRIVTGRGRLIWNGVRLALLASAQLLTGEELLVDAALAGLLVVAVLAVSRPQAARERVREVAAGLGTALAGTLVICGYPLWVQFHGPLTEHGSPWQVGNYASSLSAFVTPSGGLLLHTAASAAYAANYPSGLWEYLAYLGWPLLIVLPVAAVVYWRDLRVRAAAVCWVVLEALSLGGGTLTIGGLHWPAALLPYHWLQSLPLFSQILPGRLAIPADGAAAALLAFSLDLARRPRQQETVSRARMTLPVTVAILAVLPLIPLPMQAETVTPLPAGWQTAFSKLNLAQGDTVLVVPVPYSHSPDAMRWQAESGEPGSMVGGWFIGPGPTGQALTSYFGPPLTTAVARYMDDLWAGLPDTFVPTRQQVSAELAYWRPAAVVAVTSPGSRLGRFLTGILGPPGIRAGQVLAWRR